MKKMKKLLALTLAGAMMLSIAACGGTTDEVDQSAAPSNGGSTAEGAGRYTYTTVGSDPSTWSPTDWQEEPEGDYWGWCVTNLWDFMINDTKDGYKIVPSGATELPIDVTADLSAAQKTMYGIPADADEGYAWQIELNDQVCWEDGQKITADDYVYTLQQFLNPEMKNYRASLWYSGITAIANARAYYNGGNGGGVSFDKCLDDLGYSSVEEAQADGYTEFAVDLDEFWGVAAAGMVSITDETEYRDEEVDEDDEEAYVSGKYIYDNYLAPGMEYHEDYAPYYVYVGETTGSVSFDKCLDDLGYSSVEEAQADGYTEFAVDLDEFWGVAEAGMVSITDETEYRDEEVDEDDEEAYVSGKYIYDNYLAPGTEYHEDYAPYYVYVGEVQTEDITWDQVGVIKNGDYSFTIVLTYPQTPFNAVYGLNDLVCVHKDLYEANKQQTGDIIKSSYGTTPEKFISYGPYKIVSYQPDKEMRFTKNESWWGYSSEIYEGMYQTTDIVYLIMSDHNTELSLFLQGNLSVQGLSSNDMSAYGSSDYAYYSPGAATWKWSFVTDLEKLQEEEHPGENHSILAYQEFREAISWATDRQDYVASCVAVGQPAFGVLSDVYVCDPATGESYRSTPYAQAVLCNVYGASNVNEITGYDLEKASALLQSAYDKCLADGNISETDKVVLDFHQNGSDERYIKITNFVQAALDKAATGTSLEGRITINMVEDPDYYDNMRNGLCDIAFTGWSGSDMDPYAMMECWCSDSLRYETYGFDPYSETATITLDGEEITMTLNEWYEALCAGEYTSASLDTRNRILAGMEEVMLSLFFAIPIYESSTATLYQQRIVLGSEEYINSLVDRGGVPAMTYTMDDAEWAEYCASQNNQLTY